MSCCTYTGLSRGLALTEYSAHRGSSFTANKAAWGTRFEGRPWAPEKWISCSERVELDITLQNQPCLGAVSPLRAPCQHGRTDEADAAAPPAARGFVHMLEQLCRAPSSACVGVGAFPWMNSGARPLPEWV